MPRVKDMMKNAAPTTSPTTFESLGSFQKSGADKRHREDDAGGEPVDVSVEAEGF
jgi:hypothetical protein